MKFCMLVSNGSAIRGHCYSIADTDSIYYVKRNIHVVPEGEALGQMKREHVGRRIYEFVAGGPKNYAIQHSDMDGGDRRANLKIRSFRLSYATSQLLNFEKMKELILANYNIDGPMLVFCCCVVTLENLVTTC